MRRHRRKHGASYREIELNIMPFIDIFSMLNTFLLFSAVFVSIGILEVQIPFLSNAAPPPTEKTRQLSVTVEIEKDKLKLRTEWSEPPVDKQQQEWSSDKSGIEALHRQLLTVQDANPDADRLTLFADDDVIYEKLTDVIDAVKYRWEGDPVARPTATKSELEVSGAEPPLFPKVVIGSIML